MNILVTGANGQLGNELQIVTRSGRDRYIFTDICEGYEYLDITDIEAIKQFVKRYDISGVINCAAWTNVDTAENAGIIVEKINTKAPENLAFAMKDRGGILVHISTDYVFGADPYNTPCNEQQEGTPTGVYGLTKLQAEKRIHESGCKYVILRTAWLYSKFGKNFLKTMLHLTETQSQIRVVYDQCGTPTYARDLAEAIFDIVDQRKFEGNTGIYHYSNEGVCSWYDFAQQIARIAGNTACDIQPCRSSEYPSSVIRPAYSVLDKSKIKQVFGLHVPYWVDSLQRCLECMKNNDVLEG